MSNTRTTGSTPTGRQRRWAAPLGVVSVATSALANNESGSRILECRSGIVTHGDIQMSVATATSVPTALLPDTTSGSCSLR